MPFAPRVVLACAVLVACASDEAVPTSHVPERIAEPICADDPQDDDDAPDMNQRATWMAAGQGTPRDFVGRAGHRGRAGPGVWGE